jgi:hypothetical protein
VILTCNEIKDGRTGELTADGHRTYTRTWRVVTTDDRDGPLNATDTNEIPTVGVPYATDVESDFFARVKSVTPKQSDEDPRLWIVTVQYDTRNEAPAAGGGSGNPGSGGTGGTGGTNPLNEPTKWRMSWETQNRAILKDKDNLPLRNSAKVPFSPPVEVPKPIGRITAVKNYSQYPYTTAQSYWNKVNEGAWYGFFADTVKVGGIEIVEMFEKNMSYVQVTWTLLWDPDGWIPYYVMDKGWFYINGGVKKAFKDRDGNLYEGNLTAGGDDGGDTVRYLPFRLYDRTSFAGIP